MLIMLSVLQESEEAKQEQPPEEKKQQEAEAGQLLAHTSPFSFLPFSVRRQLAARARRIAFKGPFMQLLFQLVT